MLKAATFALLIPLLLFGCAAKPAGKEPNANGTSSFGTGSFALPQSPVAYAATYAIDEGSGMFAQKKVWRKDSRMRIEIAAGGGNSLGLYFVSGKAYSCAKLGGSPSCFEITGGLSSESASQLASVPDFSSAEPAEEVDIGNTKGRCFLFPYKVFEKRKECFTDRGVLAFDQYNVTNGKTHTEYLTSLIYGADDSDFALPAEPQAAPQAPAN